MQEAGHRDEQEAHPKAARPGSRRMWARMRVMPIRASMGGTSTRAQPNRSPVAILPAWPAGPVEFQVDAECRHRGQDHEHHAPHVIGLAADDGRQAEAGPGEQARAPFDRTAGGRATRRAFLAAGRLPGGAGLLRRRVVVATGSTVTAATSNTNGTKCAKI